MKREALTSCGYMKATQLRTVIKWWLAELALEILSVTNHSFFNWWYMRVLCSYATFAKFNCTNANIMCGFDNKFQIWDCLSWICYLILDFLKWQWCWRSVEKLHIFLKALVYKDQFRFEVVTGAPNEWNLILTSMHCASCELISLTLTLKQNKCE